MAAEDLPGEWSGWFLITIADIFPEEETQPVTSIKAASSQARVWFPHIPCLKTRLDFLEAASIEICMKPIIQGSRPLF